MVASFEIVAAKTYGLGYELSVFSFIYCKLVAFPELLSDAFSRASAADVNPERSQCMIVSVATPSWLESGRSEQLL